MKRKVLLFFIVFIICNRIFSQINLVPNYSFEDTLSCPQAQGFTFYSYTPPWFSCNMGTPDIYNTCSTDTHASVPSYNNGTCFQYPKTGNGFAGFCALINSNSKEYLSVKLKDTLETGKKYCVSFYVNLINTAYIAIDAIGAYLSKDSMYFSNYTTIHVQPQIENPHGNVIKDTLNWVEISGEYIATGGEQYITIGDFKDDSLNVVDTIPSGYEGAFYNLDDVSVYYCDTIYKAEAGKNKTICEGDSVQIGLPPNSDCYYKWQAATTLSNDTIANPWVNPTATTTYYLQQTFMSNITTDSVKVTVISCEDTTTNSLSISNAFTPNGDGVNDYFKVKGTNIKSLTGKIFNRWGQELFKFNDVNSKWDGKYKGKEVSSGTYFYIINVVFNDNSTETKHGCIEIVR